MSTVWWDTGGRASLTARVVAESVAALPRSARPSSGPHATARSRCCPATTGAQGTRTTSAEDPNTGQEPLIHEVQIVVAAEVLLQVLVALLAHPGGASPARRWRRDRVWASAAPYRGGPVSTGVHQSRFTKVGFVPWCVTCLACDQRRGLVASPSTQPLVAARPVTHGRRPARLRPRRTQPSRSTLLRSTSPSRRIARRLPPIAQLVHHGQVAHHLHG